MPFFRKLSLQSSSSNRNCGKAVDFADTRHRRLTRQRKLRYLTDSEVGFQVIGSPLSSPVSPDSAQKSPSPSPRGSDHWSSSAVPKPLPLPEFPLRLRQQSPDSHMDIGNGGTTKQAPSYSTRRKSADNVLAKSAKSSGHDHKELPQDSHHEDVKFNLRVNIPSRGAFNGGFSSLVSPKRSNTTDSFHAFDIDSFRSPCNCHIEFSHRLNVSDANYDSRHNVTAKSAPASSFSSPVVSPRRSGSGDFGPSSSIAHQEFQNSTTCEFPGLGRHSAFTSHMSPVKAMHSLDHSRLHSPKIQRSRFNSAARNEIEFPRDHKSLPESYREGPESKSRANAHPLPRPPGPVASSQLSMPLQSAAVHHAEVKKTSSMKSQWQKGKLIGHGTYGRVYVAINRVTGALCAMKEVDIIPDDPKSAECIKQLEQEIEVLSHLNHPNIVQYYGCEVVDDHFYIYLELIYPGSVKQYIREHGGAITESIVRNFTRHILSGLAYLHSTRTIHRDIKGANLLVNASGVVKLADFGLAKHLTGLSYDLSLKGSPYWMAPELMQSVMQKEAKSDLAFAVDIWSLGCTVIEMLDGKPPWSELEWPRAMFKVLHRTPPIPEALSAEAKDFLQLCFRRKPAERPSALMLLEHSFVRNSNDQNMSLCMEVASKMSLKDKSPSPRDCAMMDFMPASSGTQIINGKLSCDRRTCQQYSATQRSSCSLLKVIPSSPTTTLIPGPLDFRSANVSGNLPLECCWIERDEEKRREKTHVSLHFSCRGNYLIREG